MLVAHAPGTRGNLVFIGFDPRDLDHLTAQKPLSIDGNGVGIPGKPVVILYETDPMVEFYAAQPWVMTILFRRSTLDALRGTPRGFLQLPLAGEGVPANTIAMLFFEEDDAALIRTLEGTGLTKGVNA